MDPTNKTSQDIRLDAILSGAKSLNESGWTCNGGEHEPVYFEDCADYRRVNLGVVNPAIEAFLENILIEEKLAEVIYQAIRHALALNQILVVQNKTHLADPGVYAARAVTHFLKGKDEKSLEIKL